MKVKEFIELLKQQDLEREVILADDSEFALCSPFSQMVEMGYVKESCYSGSAYYEELTQQQIDDGVPDDMAIQPGDNYVEALLLLPEN